MSRGSQFYLVGYMWLILACCGGPGLEVECQTPGDVNTLLNDLFTDYNPRVRPVQDQVDPVVMDVSLYLFSVNEVDEVSEKLVTTGFLDLRWNDGLLQWDPNSYNEIDVLNLPQKDIWRPDLVLKNGFTKFKELGGDHYYLTINYTGDVFWYPYEVFETRCAIDITYFPFDEQTCDISFIIWCYTVFEVIISKSSNGVNEYEYEENAIWTIVDTDSEVKTESYESQITFSVTLQRKPQYYVINIIIPIVCLGFLSQLVFVIPTEAGEKMSYAVTVFLSFAVFLTMISADLPKNSESTSILSVYLVVQMMTGGLVLIISAVELRLHHRKSTNRVSTIFVGIVKAERRLRCVIPCRSSGKVDVTLVEELGPNAEKNSNESCIEIEWSDVTSSIDFFCFLIFFILNVSVTLFLFLYISGNI